jgi:hypothetical protein
MNLANFIAAINPMVIILAIAALALVVALWRAQRDSKNPFDAFDLVMETGPDGSRKASKTGVAFMTVLAVTTWTVVNMAISKTLTEGLFAIYCAAWVTPLVAKVIFGKTDPPMTGLRPHDREDDGHV